MTENLFRVLSGLAERGRHHECQATRYIAVHQPATMAEGARI